MHLTGRRLTLIATTLDHLDAELAGGPAALGSMLHAAVPPSWPPGEYDRDALHFFHAQLTAGGPGAVGWYGWYAVTGMGADAPALVGAGGFFGPPDAAGVVEVGYSVAPEHRGRGYATELVQLLVAHARRDSRVRTIQAHTTTANAASVRVLERTGFRRTGAAASDPTAQVRFEHVGGAT